MPKWIGNRFGNNVPVTPGVNATPAVYSLFDQYYAQKESAWHSDAAGPFSITGGNATSTAGGYKYFYFTSSGSLAITNNSPNAGPLTISFMLIGGGGASSTTGGGGGGAGAVIQKIDLDLGNVPSGSLGSWPVTIGAGGQTEGTDGNSSAFTITTTPTTFTAPGGGAGKQSDGFDGGSGGGGGRGGPNGGDSNVPQTISAGNTPPSGIGHDGAAGSGPQNPAGGGTGGGGGGAGAVGQQGTGTKAGNGGNGIPAFNGDSNVSPSYGTPGPSPGRWFAGGGGGGAHYSVPGGTGGTGGGGTGAPPGSGQVGLRGTQFTGGGAGGGGGAPNQYVGPIEINPSGGPGIMIFRMPTDILQ